MIQEVGNIELFELLETDPKTQCTACLPYLTAGIVYCTCWHFLQKETEANRKVVKYTMDLLSHPEYVIKKGRLHGHRYGKKPGDKEQYPAHQLKKKCHTHHLTEQEYFHCKNKWWLHLNKSGSDTLPLRKRSDFKQALSTLESLHQEAGEEQFVPTHSWTNKHWQSASSSSCTWWNWQDSWWSS